MPRRVIEIPGTSDLITAIEDAGSVEKSKPHLEYLIALAELKEALCNMADLIDRAEEDGLGTVAIAESAFSGLDDIGARMKTFSSVCVAHSERLSPGRER